MADELRAPPVIDYMVIFIPSLFLWSIASSSLCAAEPSLPMQVESSMAMATEALPDVQILLSLFLFVWSSLPSSSPLPAVV